MSLVAFEHAIPASERPQKDRVATGIGQAVAITPRNFKQSGTTHRDRKGDQISMLERALQGTIPVPRVVEDFILVLVWMYCTIIRTRS
jgi:hypothetical protein